MSVSGNVGARSLLASFALGLAAALVLSLAVPYLYGTVGGHSKDTGSFSFRGIRSGVTTYVSGGGESLCLRESSGGVICAPIFQQPGSPQVREGQPIKVADVVVTDGSASVEFFVVVDPPPPAMPISSTRT